LRRGGGKGTLHRCNTPVLPALPASMSPPCDLTSWFPVVPMILARSASIKCRIGRGFVLFAVLAGQVGLPTLWRSERRGIPSEAASTTCQCSPSLKRIGRCCCSSHRRPESRSCCAGRNAVAKTSVPRTCRATFANATKTSAAVASSKTRLALRAACSCDSPDHRAVFRCADPRLVLVHHPVAPAEMTPTRLAVDSAAPCGESFPPPLPPPKAC
jgi:hypothetical protein